MTSAYLVAVNEQLLTFVAASVSERGCVVAVLLKVLSLHQPDNNPEALMSGCQAWSQE